MIANSSFKGLSLLTFPSKQLKFLESLAMCIETKRGDEIVASRFITHESSIVISFNARRLSFSLTSHSFDICIRLNLNLITFTLIFDLQI